MQVEVKKLALGASSRYQSIIQNVDVVFNELVPGVKRYREEHTKGAWVFDARIGYKINKHLNVAAICRNVFNTEYMGVPADLQPPRSWVLQVRLVN
jgi:outer membrane receptor protein involved in Fe transport